MGFFDITPGRPPRRWRRPGLPSWSRPDGVIPGVAHIGLMLVHTEGMAVAVSSVAAYPNGFEFSVHARLHHEQFTWGMSPLDPDGHQVTMHYPEQALRLGILYADGRQARSGNRQPGSVDDTGTDDLVLIETGTGGTERQWDGKFWVHPLPPDGPVTFVASWQLWGVTEVSETLGSSVIHQAARSAVILWPDQP